MRIDQIMQSVKTENCFYYRPGKPDILFFDQWIPQINYCKTFVYHKEKDSISTDECEGVLTLTQREKADDWACGEKVPLKMWEIVYGIDWSVSKFIPLNPPAEPALVLNELPEGWETMTDAEKAEMQRIEADCLNNLRQTGIALPHENPELAKKFAEENGIPIRNGEPTKLEELSEADIAEINSDDVADQVNEISEELSDDESVAVLGTVV